MERKGQDWIQDLNEEISLEEWGTIYSKAQSQTINT